MRIHKSCSESETEAIGRALGRSLLPGAVVALSGDLGAGKTAFVRGLAVGLGIAARVYSPTFTIVNEYEGSMPLFHFDLYRLGGEDELFEIGWDDYTERGGVIAAEWSDNVLGAFPEHTIRVRIIREGDKERSIEIEDPRA